MRVLVISDLQAPFEHPQSLEFCQYVSNKYKCNEWVCVGDEIDCHALSDYESDPDGLSIGHELECAVKTLRGFYKAFPKMKVCVSNHTIRPYKRAYSAGIPSRLMRSYKEFLDAPDGWYWDESWEVDGVVYEHGDAFSGKDAPHKAATGNMRSTVFGHIHAFAGISYVQRPGHDLIFGMNVGSLINDKAYAFRYNKKQKHRPVLSCGVVIDGVPYLEPMKLNKAGKWVK